MTPKEVQVVVTLVCALLALVSSQSDMIPDPSSFEVIPPDRMEILEHFQLVLGAIQRLDARVGNLDKKLEILDTSISTRQGMLETKMDSVDIKIGALDTKMSGKQSQVETHFGTLEKAVQTLDTKVFGKLGLVEVKLEAMDSKVNGKLTIMEAKLESAEAEIKAVSEKLGHVESTALSTLAILNKTEEESLQKLDSTEEDLDLTTELPVTSTWTEVQRQEIISTILNKTRGRLYKGVNFTGEFYDYNMKNIAGSLYAGCLNLPKTDFKSVDPHNGCIRIFSGGSYCLGSSLAVYPGSDKSHDISAFNFSRIVSLGPCLPNEFEFSRLSNDTDGVRVTKNRTNSGEIPDQALIGSHDVYDSKATSVRSSTNPITKYFLGSRNKILYFQAVIYKRHLNRTPPTASIIKDSSIWRSFDKKDGDDLGFLIPPSMGGPGNEVYNIFPQSRRNLLEWTKLLSNISSFIVEESYSNYLLVYVNFAYPNESTNRPHGFYYQGYIYRPNIKTKRIYGFIRN